MKLSNWNEQKYFKIGNNSEYQNCRIHFEEKYL